MLFLNKNVIYLQPVILNLRFALSKINASKAGMVMAKAHFQLQPEFLVPIKMFPSLSENILHVLMWLLHEKIKQMILEKMNFLFDFFHILCTTCLLIGKQILLLTKSSEDSKNLLFFFFFFFKISIMKLL